MTLLAPAFLLGLLGLAIPIIIHLWSNQSSRKIPFGSIRFLKETETKSMRSIMPSQWLLLLTRLLLLIILVLIMADPYVNRSQKSYDSIVIVDTSYESEDWLKVVQDTISDDTKIVWLAEDFPDINEPAPEKTSNYWSLLSNPPSSSLKYTIISPLLLKDFRGSKISFPVKYDWVILPMTPEKTTTLSYSKHGESKVLETTFDEWSTYHTLQTSATSSAPITVTYSMRVDEGYKNLEKIFEAAISTLNLVSPIEISEKEPTDMTDWVIWLSNAEPPDRTGLITVEASSLQVWNEILPGFVYISPNISQEEAIQANLPQKLLDTFTKSLKPKLIEEFDQRTVDIRNFRTTEEIENGADLKLAQSAASIFWILLATTLILERWLSFKIEKNG